MSEAAPERIWLGLQLSNPEAGFHDLGTVDWLSAPSDEADVEYIRADVADAAIAKARAEAYREGWAFAYRQCERTGSVPNPDHGGAA